MGSVFQNQSVKAKPHYVPQKKSPEASLQRQVCTYLKRKYPQVIFRSDYSSGVKLSKAQAIIHKSIQSCRAWPDLFIYAPRRGFHGLAIELKKDKTAIIVTMGPRKGHLVADPHIQEQYLLLKELKRLGYYAEFGVGYDATVKIIDWYFGNVEPVELPF